MRSARQHLPEPRLDPLPLKLQAFLLLLLAAPLFAAPRDIAFAVPDAGAITLGVFDSHGHLVRRLHSLAPESEFRVGLNGLITSWDGLSDSGKVCAPGTYFVRGYLVPDLETTGEAFHFNDLIRADTDPLVNRLHAAVLLDGQRLLLTGKLRSGGYFAGLFDPSSGWIWSLPFTEKCLVAPFNGQAAILSGGQWHWVTIEDGTSLPVSWPPAPGVNALCAAPDGILYSEGTGIFQLNPASARIRPSVVPAPPCEALAFFEGRVFGISKGRLNDLSSPSPNLLSGFQAVSIAASQSLWSVISGEPPPDGGVSELAANGNIIRQIANEPGSPPVAAISARGEALALLCEDDRQQIIRLLSGAPGGTWEVTGEITLRSAANFGFAGDEVVPETGTESSSLRFRLPASDWTPEAVEIELFARSAGDGAEIVDTDGLLIAKVGAFPSPERVVWRREGLNAARILAGTTCGAAEYRVRNLDRIVPLIVGSLSLP